MRYLLCLAILFGGALVPEAASAGLMKAVIAKRRETHEGISEKMRHKKVMKECKDGKC